VAHLVREENRLVGKFCGGSGAVKRPEVKGPATPAAATAALRALRESTLAVFRRSLPLRDDDKACRLIQTAVSLAQLDAHALGLVSMLHRLIDPSRTAISPR
jgi:hypothetical protein